MSRELSKLERWALWATIVAVPLALLSLIPPVVVAPAMPDDGTVQDQLKVGMEEEKLRDLLSEYNNASNKCNQMESDTSEKARAALGCYKQVREKVVAVDSETDSAIVNLGYVPSFKRRMDVQKKRIEALLRSTDGMIDSMEAIAKTLEQSQRKD